MFYMRYLTSVLFLFLGILPLVSFGQEVHTIKAIGDLLLSDQFQVRVNGQESQIEYSCFWNTRWPGNEKLPQTDHDAIDSNGNINPTGYSLLIWNKFMGDKMIKSESKGYIISYASYSPQKDQLFVYLINKGDREESVNIVIPGKVDAKVVQCWEYFGKDDKDLAPVWQQRDVKELSNYSLSSVYSLNT